ncbi:MAG: L-serine ammonia-lyase, iron-sulfur-dependent, subunit alpha [Spirochaetaceae bacterium]|nr:L-serine ammonia-lyase, iron-sulfur-dependent, subunit alpha [Spirochaetaceae bacterium]MCL2705524.1 L-serine ammonia-lyase, iron-sulfur-dependent, subunit alpha [Spirochaetaceae bacterium]
MDIYPTIFNHTLGPVTVGPSSSNTAALFRTGKLIHQLADGIPKNVTVKLAAATSFARTYLGMKSDLAFTNGLLGRSITEPDFDNAYKYASDAALSISFDTKSWQGTGTIKGSWIEITCKDSSKLTVIADSIGGGAIKLLAINGCPVSIEGDYYELLIFTKKTSAEKLKQIADTLLEKNSSTEFYLIEGSENLSLIEFKSRSPFNKNLTAQLSNKDEIIKISALDPVYPVIVAEKAKPPFTSAEEMISYADKNNFELWQAAVEYEKSLCNWTEKQILDYAKKLWQIILDSIEKGMKSDFNMNGIMTPKAKEISEKFNTKNVLPMGVLDIAVPVSLAVMEFSNASGLIVCIPTGGSCGIVPAVIYSAGKYLKADNDTMAKALLASGIIGICMTKDNTFSGGQMGCQAEIACGAAMAAGALVQMLGGSPKQSCDSASMTLQALLGLVCDPVAGLVQVPCIARNMSATATVVVSANSIMAGYDAVIPFDDMFLALKEVGKIVSPCKGIGCTTTPTGSRLAKDQYKRDMDARRIP